MYSSKQNVNILTALLVAHGIRHAVVCPGSRNSPIVHNLNECPDIECYPVTDERSAGFYALGMAQKLRRPVVVCVTSGTALFAFGLASGINSGVLEKKQYAGTLQKAWKYLTEIALQDDNTIGYIQPVGERAQRGQTLSEANYYDFGVGAYLLMLSEMYKMAK